MDCDSHKKKYPPCAVCGVGAETGEGENHLGRPLMQVRSESLGKQDVVDAQETE